MDDLSPNPKRMISHDSLVSDALAAHLFSHELALLDPAVRHDRQRVDSLLAEDFQEFGASGRIWSRSQILDLLASELARPITVHELACHAIANGVALITYRAISTDPQTSEPSATLRSSLWACIEGEWKMRFHQGTRQHKSSD
jgi:hypothetical protein